MYVCKYTSRKLLDEEDTSIAGSAKYGPVLVEKFKLRECWFSGSQSVQHLERRVGLLNNYVSQFARVSSGKFNT
jgi:hypothetical protein